MKHTLLFGLLVAFALWALPAFAANTTRFPATILEQTCTDSYDVPAAQTGGGTRPAVQISGSADTRCDHDSRITTAAITTSPVTFGPFYKNDFGGCVYIFVDANTVTGGDAGWILSVHTKTPHTAEWRTVDTTGELTGVTDETIVFGRSPWSGAQGSADIELSAPIPNTWYIWLSQAGATSWTGEISMVSCN